MAGRVFGAVDIGASGGRVMAGVVDAGQVELHTIHRFANGARRRGGHLRWDLTGLFNEVVVGLRGLSSAFPEVESIGIDTWAVDYGLLGLDGRLLGEPVSYRDGRTGDAIERVHSRVSRSELYAVNGLQYLPFNTLYQLEAEKGSRSWDQAAHAVLLPDLISFWLTGALRTEGTNASTTGLVDVQTGDWSADLFARLELPPTLFPPIDQPGATRGTLLPRIADRTGLGPRTTVTTVGSHDTASAVVAVPAVNREVAYVSSGTWSLVGVELDRPLLSDDARRANFTNEGGVDGRIRFLKNVGGLWLLQESMRTWVDEGSTYDLPSLLTEAETIGPGGPTVDVDDEQFIPPGDMPRRIATAVRSSGGDPPTTPAATVRCILDSLANAYAHTVQTASSITGRTVETIHIVGGGSQNALLGQLTADQSGLPVVSGPVEATALGNVLVQARAHGAAPESLEQIRRDLAAHQPTRRFAPRQSVSP